MKKTALITGATGVIGHAIAKRFSQDGFVLILAGRSKDKLVALEAEFGPSTITAVIDVGDEKNVKDVFAEVKNRFGTLDAMVVASGTYGAIGSVESCDINAWMDAIRTNLLGTMLTVKYAIPLMKERGGSIITFAGGGEGPLPHFSAYVSSKGGVIRFTETVAKELEEYQIRVNAIAPGAVNSGLVTQLLDAGPERAGADAYARAKEQMETGGVSPERAAELVSFLASDASRGITGRVLSALHDRFTDLPKHLTDLNTSDVYTWRRIKPKDRGYDW